MRKKLNDITTSVFITTPTLNELEKRLIKRNTDTETIIQNRLKNAKIELESLDKYDYFILNDDLDVASKKLISIGHASMIKASLFSKQVIIENWIG